MLAMVAAPIVVSLAREAWRTWRPWRLLMRLLRSLLSRPEVATSGSNMLVCWCVFQLRRNDAATATLATVATSASASVHN